MSHSHYKNKESIVLESDILRAEIIPNPGGKLASLKNKKSGREYFIQRANEVYKEVPYGGTYVDAECAGFDDMFPTIDVCHYESYPWQGNLLVCHGEVWSIPWNVDFHDDKTLEMSTHGIRFPYSLKKRISLKSDGTLLYEYELKNHSKFDMDYLFAAHMMTEVEKGTKIDLPEDCKDVFTMFSNAGHKYCEVQTWPNLTDENGKTYPANIFRGPESRGNEKFYFSDKIKDGWVKFTYPNGDLFKVTFTTDQLPYLGLLIDEYGWDDINTVIVEPCSICYDRPDVAAKFNQKSVLPGNGEVKWALTIGIED